MSTQYEIVMNFKAAVAQANKLEDIAERLIRVSDNDYNNTLQNISSAWKGENAQAFISKSSLLIEKMDNTAESLRSAADTVRQIAINIYEAEMAALTVAREREY